MFKQFAGDPLNIFKSAKEQNMKNVLNTTTDLQIQILQTTLEEARLSEIHFRKENFLLSHVEAC